MKKVSLLACFATLALSLPLGSLSFTPSFEVKGADGKETVLFDFKDEAALNDNVILLNTDIELPAFEETSFEWYVNLKAQPSFTLANSGPASAIYLAWNGLRPAEGSLPYKHFQIKAGTTIAENDTTQYVLRNDYNFWWTQGSGTLSWRQFVFQHGGNDAPSAQNFEAPSLSFKGEVSGGVQADCKRWLFNVPYEKSTDWSTNAAPSNGNAVYIDKGNGYELYDFNLKDDGFLHIDSPIPSASRGTALMIVKFAPFGTTTGEDLDHRLSLYFPKGHLFGGTNDTHAFMLEEDAYLEIGKNGALSGVFSTPHDYVKHDAVCGHPGNVEYYTCSRHADEEEIFVKDGDNYLAKTLDEIQVNVEHSFAFVEEKPCSCDVDGVSAHYECSTCHKSAVKEGDDYRLVESDELLIPAAHTLVHHDEVPFTCQSDGKRACEECSVCHKLYISDDGELVEVTESDLIIAKHHTPFTVEGKEATCLEGGYTASKKCSVCDEVIEESKEIPALGHRYGGWKVDDDGEHISHYCERCYQVETVALTDNSDFTYTVIEEASGSSKGLVLYSSEKYGSFYVELPMAPSKGDATTTNIIISGVLAGVAVGVSIGGFFLIKKKFAKTK